VKNIVDLMMTRVRDQLKAKDIDIELTDAAKTLLATQGFDASLGARPLRRTIQRLVEDPLSEKLLWKEFRAGQTIIVDAQDGEIVFDGGTIVPEEIPPEIPPVELAGSTEKPADPSRRTSFAPAPGSDETPELFRHQIRELPGRPHVGGELTGRSLHPETLEVFAHPEEIALEQSTGVPILPRVDRLREVDERRLAFPDQDVVRREVAVDDVAIQEQLDVAQYLTEQLPRLIGVRAVAAQLRRGVVLVPDVGHQERPVGSHERSRHVGPGLEQRSEHLPFTIDPDRRRDLLPERRLLLDGDPDPSFLDELAVSVQPFIPERAAIRGVEHLQRGQRLAGRARVRAAQMDGSLLAALDRSDDLGDEPFI
jgi:hypothetical protein